MKLILKVITIAMILCAAMMSGCIDDAKESIVEKTVEAAIEKAVEKAVETATEDVMFGITFPNDGHTNPCEMEVAINDGGGAIIRMNGEIFFGDWEIYRETSAGDIYDVTYGNTELRIYMKSGGMAVGNWYEKEFTKCGESFYGEWQADPFGTAEPTSTPIQTLGTSEKAEYMERMPKTIMLHGMTEHNIDLKRYILFEDETVELCSVYEISTGKWEWVYRTPDTRTYTISIKNRHTDKISSADLIVDLDGTAELDMGAGKSYYGTWDHGIDRSRGTCDEADEADDPPIANDNSGPSDIPITCYMDLGALYDEGGDDIIRIVLENDGTSEYCGVIMFPGKTLHAKVRGECTYGTWEHGSSDHQYVSTEEFLGEIRITCMDDGEADFVFEGGVSTDGVWREGNDRP